MVQVDETFELAGQPWRAVHQDGTVIVFQHLLDRRVRKLPVAELLADPTYVPHRRSPTPVLDDVAILNGLPVEDARRALWLRHHVHELLYGVPPVAPDADETAKPSRSRQVTPSDDGDPVPNVRYGADVPMGEKVDAKVAELEAAGTPVSERQLRRHMAAYQRLGTAGLVDQRKLRTKTATGRVDARIVELIKEAMQEQTLKSTRSRRTLITRVLVKVDDLNAAGENIPVPSWATLYRTLSGLEGNRHTFGEATTRRTQGNKPDRAYGYQAVARPGELVEIDSTPLDAMVIFPDGTIGRPDVTIAIDVATRTLCANMLLAGAAKSADAASILLARTMTPMWMQPGWKETLAYARSILPFGAILGDAELRELLAARPVITPEAITIDRGKVFVGTTFLEACERLQISVTKAAPRTPTDKPHVERAFSAINSSFTESLDGYLGMRVAHRGDDPSPEGLLTLAEVQALLDQWVVQVWQNRPHDGLRHPAIPRERLTPNEMYAAAAAVAPTMNVVLTPDDYVELLPKDSRRPNEYGINFEGLVYDSPGLRQLYRDNAHLLGPDAKLELRYEPYRLNNIWVKDVTNSTWVQVDWRYAKHVHAPFSRDMLKVVKKLTKDRSVTGNDLQIEWVRELARIQTQGARTPEERRHQNRALTHPGAVPDQPDDTEDDQNGEDQPLTGMSTSKGKGSRKDRAWVPPEDVDDYTF